MNNQNPIRVNRSSLPRCLWHPNKAAAYSDATCLIAFLQGLSAAMAENKSCLPDGFYAGLGLVLDLLADKVAVIGGELAWPEVESEDSRLPSLMELLKAGQTAFHAAPERFPDKE